MPQYKAVLDANVFVSALIKPEGPPGKILKYFLEQHLFELILSPDISKEISQALNYPNVLKLCSFSKKEIQLFIISLELLSETVEGSSVLDIDIKDEDDMKYLIAAAEGKATHIVSGDHHLLDLHEYESIKIVTPRTFLSLIEN